MWTRVIYTTITPMAVLIIYDGWEQLRSWNVVTVIVGPLLAIFFITSSFNIIHPFSPLTPISTHIFSRSISIHHHPPLSSSDISPLPVSLSRGSSR